MSRFTDRSRSVLTGTLRRSRTIVITTALVAGLVTGCSASPVATQPPAGPTTTSAQAPSTSPADPATAQTTAPGAAPVATTVIAIQNFLFVPGTLTVPAGATVTVNNQDGANHTLTANDGSFDTGNIPGHATGRFTAPKKPGSYPYKCAIHPFMTGTLTVT